MSSTVRAPLRASAVTNTAIVIVLKNIKPHNTQCQKMTNLTSLPTENVLQIFSLLPNSDLISVGETCEHLLHLSRTELATRTLAALQDPRRKLSSSDLDMAADLVTYLPEEGRKILAARVQATWSSGGYQYYPSVGKVKCAAWKKSL